MSALKTATHCWRQATEAEIQAAQITDQHLKAYQTSVNKRIDRRSMAAHPPRPSFVEQSLLPEPGQGQPRHGYRGPCRHRYGLRALPGSEISSSPRRVDTSLFSPILSKTKTEKLCLTRPPE
jgi:hypothetical protein